LRRRVRSDRDNGPRLTARLAQETRRDVQR
jgi:hypothetical protein